MSKLKDDICQYERSDYNERECCDKYLRIIIILMRNVFDWKLRSVLAFLATTICLRVQLIPFWASFGRTYSRPFLTSPRQRISIITIFARFLTLRFGTLFAAISQNI